MSKFYKSDIISIYEYSFGGIDYNCPGKFVHELTCQVCGEKPWPKHNPSSKIGNSNVIIIDDTYFVVPLSHKKCRELFDLNPLAYV